jgi:hypothetical protein
VSRPKAMSTIGRQIRHIRHSLLRLAPECSVLSFDMLMGLPRKPPKVGDAGELEWNLQRAFRRVPFHSSLRAHLQGRSTGQTVPIAPLIVG